MSNEDELREKVEQIKALLEDGSSMWSLAVGDWISHIEELIELVERTVLDPGGKRPSDRTKNWSPGPIVRYPCLSSANSCTGKAEKPPGQERLVRQVRIKKGVRIFQDHRFMRWPQCLPPKKEYEGQEYRYEAKDPDMEFEGTWNGRYWDCKADGYGHLRHKGDPGEYGNGSILVDGLDSVEIVE